MNKVSWLTKVVTVVLITTAVANAQPPLDCSKLQQDCDAAVLALKTQVKDQDDMIQALTKQRNQAISDAGERGLLPWYGWLLIGAAGATFAIGLRR